MFDFFKTLFKPQGSGATAKERLRLVLLSDHISLAPDVVEALKADLLAVIARYVEFDESQADVSFETREREVAMLASVPILRVKTDRPSAPRPPDPRVPVTQTALNGVTQPPAKPRPRRRRRKASTQTVGQKPAASPGAQSPAQA